jgi:hypothetical protein
MRVTAPLKAIAGLPGSGKTLRIKQLMARGYMARDDMNINWAASISQVKEWLREGKSVVVSDIEFVKREWRDRLNRELADVEVGWEFFENDPHKCIRNVVFRVFAEGQHRPLREEVGKIRDYTKVYCPPTDALPVILADSTPEGLAKFHGSPQAALDWALGMVASLEGKREG